jgi:hypothetical protein
VIQWLLGAGLGPAAVALPVNWTGAALAAAAQRWFRRFRRTDDLSRLVTAATGTSVALTKAEFNAVRRTLEDAQTWALAGHGTVQDLAALIAAFLPAREGRTAEDSTAAAMTIARGLLEFAVADLDPRLFQQLLLARLQRFETKQASTLDEAMLDLHADLITGLAAAGQLDAERFNSVMGHLKQVLDRLPPGPADRGEIAVYLNTLIDWLSTDPWPHDRRLHGPVLTSAALERALRITATSQPADQDFGADEMAEQCRRLVILGGPGSGKTWLAKRTARRCAERARTALASGDSLDEIELPLYTTCSRLFGVGGEIRQAVVSSALGELADLGGSRLSAAIHLFFTERNAPTVLVIDSLDEARGSSERLRQADTLPWRIVLTSRPSSWNLQLGIRQEGDSDQVGELQPLRYPDDVEAFIRRWFAERPFWGEDLLAQIVRRPSLQRAATVPLILAFYCIIGGSEPLPDFRHELYAKVLKRLLTGRWRGLDENQPDMGTCLDTLRAWAWSGATSDPVSGVGIWPDDIVTARSPLSAADEDGVDHVAAPLGPPDIDTGQTIRRFIHRSIREYLVAEHVAGLPVDQAADILFQHLWYDPDWEYSAPAALAMHPQRDRLLQSVICRAARSRQIPGDLSVIDAGWEVRRLLVRVAAESSEADWSPALAGLISQARVELTGSARIDRLGQAAHWRSSNRKVCETLLELLAKGTYNWAELPERLVSGIVHVATNAAEQRQTREELLKLLSSMRASSLRLIEREILAGLAQLKPTAEDKRRARKALLGSLAEEWEGYWVAQLVAALARLGPTAEDKRQAFERLLSLLAGQSGVHWPAELIGGLVQLASTAEEKRLVRKMLFELLAGYRGGSVGDKALDGLIRLASTEEDKCEAREQLLGLLAVTASQFEAVRLVDGLVQLDPTAQDKREARQKLLALLAVTSDWLHTAWLVGGLAQLASTADDKRQARRALLVLMASKHDYFSEVTQMLGELARLDPTPDDKRQARETLLRSLTVDTNGWQADKVLEGLAKLDPTADDKHQAREVLFRLLGSMSHHRTDDLVAWVVRLATTAEDKRQACETLLEFLTVNPTVDIAQPLLEGVVQLATTAEGKRQAREALLTLLATPTRDYVAWYIVSALIQLGLSPKEKRQAREALLGALGPGADSMAAANVARWLAQLDPTTDDKHRAREALLGLLVRQIDWDQPERLVDGVVRLSPSREDKRQACEILIGLLAVTTSWLAAVRLANALARFEPTTEDKRRARENLLRLLDSQTASSTAASLAAWVAQFDPTVEEKRQACKQLLTFLASETDKKTGEHLVGSLARLGPSVRDLTNWHAWPVPPDIELLSAARRNSAPDAWLTALPMLTSISGKLPASKDTVRRFTIRRSSTR